MLDSLADLTARERLSAFARFRREDCRETQCPAPPPNPPFCPGDCGPSLRFSFDPHPCRSRDNRLPGSIPMPRLDRTPLIRIRGGLPRPQEKLPDTVLACIFEVRFEIAIVRRRQPIATPDHFFYLPLLSLSCREFCRPAACVQAEPNLLLSSTPAWAESQDHPAPSDFRRSSTPVQRTPVSCMCRQIEQHSHFCAAVSLRSEVDIDLLTDCPSIQRMGSISTTWAQAGHAHSRGSRPRSCSSNSRESPDSSALPPLAAVVTGVPSLNLSGSSTTLGRNLRLVVVVAWNMLRRAARVRRADYGGESNTKETRRSSKFSFLENLYLPEGGALPPCEPYVSSFCCKQLLQSG